MPATTSRRAMSRLAPTALVALFAALAAWLLIAPVARAATYTVEAGCDGTDGCYNTLDDALAVAVGGDVIQLSPSEHARATTAIGMNLTIRGAGRDLTAIDAEAAGAVLTVGAAGSLTLEDLAIVAGSSDLGGGVVSNGDLTVRNVRFIDNSTTNNKNGGAIAHGAGTLSIEDSLFAGNSAEHGGGVFAGAAATVTVTRTTFNGNACDQVTGCALYLEGSGTVESSHFVTEDDSMMMNGGSITASSLGAGVGGTADASGNWWGVATPVEGTHYDGATVTVDSHLSSVDLVVTPSVTPVTGTSVTATATVRDGDGAAVVLPVAYTVSGTHAGTSTSSAGGHTYGGTSAGGDTVQASVVFGDGSVVPSTLSASVAVTWGDPAPPDDPATPTPEPTPTLTPEDKHDALTNAGLFGGGDDVNQDLLDDLADAPIANDASGNNILESESGSTIVINDDSDEGWHDEHDQIAGEQGFGTDSAPHNPASSFMFFQGITNLVMELLRLLFGFLYELIMESLQGPFGWGFVGEFQGTIQEQMSNFLGPLASTDVAAEPSTPSVEVNEPTLLRLKIVQGDLPADTTAEEVALVRLDPSVPAWVEIESIVTQLPDGAFAMSAWVSQTAVYTVMARPLEDVVIPSGIALVTWSGADGQPPSRALRHADAPVEAIFRLDPESQRWSVYRPGAPAFAQSIQALRDGEALLVLTSDAGTWRMPVW